MGQPGERAETERHTVRLATGVVLATAGVLLLVLLWKTGGTFVYVIDDPAIHLAVARRLAFDGTWGVVPGEFQSASSSPLWTLLLAPTQWLARGSAGEVVPLVLNLAAAVWVIRLLGPDLARLRTKAGPGTGSAAVLVLVVVLLYLPALAFVGMEHTLHVALVLALALAVERRWVADPASGSTWGLLLLAFLATLTRGETTFAVAGLGLAIVVLGTGPMRARWGAALGLGGASLSALAVVAVVNLAYGQELLPNSVVLKSLGDRGDTNRSPAAAWERLWTDRLLGVLLVVALGVVLVAWRRRPGLPASIVLPASVVVVATLLHVELAAVAQDIRYQSYLLALGVWMLLRLLPEALTGIEPRLPAGRRRLALAALVPLVLVAVSTLQIRRTVTVPHRAGEMYEQRYQVARFLDEAYDAEPIAVGELGYISLYHDGPLTDIYGLGDHEVLEARMADEDGDQFWTDLQQRRGFEVIAMYDFTLDSGRPRDWFRVALWESPDHYYPITEFWATVPQEVAPLLDALQAYEPELPEGVEVSYNRLARIAAERRIRDQAAPQA